MSCTMTSHCETCGRPAGTCEVYIREYHNVGESAVAVYAHRARTDTPSTPHEDDYFDDDRTRGATEIGE